MKNKSIVCEGREIALAVDLIKLGARLQLLEAETNLSRERLLKLYKEVKGMSPPKGMLPFSTDWFMTWQPNIHASLFMSFFGFFKQNTGMSQLDCIVKGFRLYQEHVQTHDMEEVLSLTRAWTLVRFFDAKLLQQTQCTCCSGRVVPRAYEPKTSYVCGLCHIPARAGKTRRAREALIAA